ncbi:MAG: hypothetical protein EU539_11795 [Promethearchaeota archaeon]|nr:MAG: hypothetical protein EU539_11795 [Candidatus Lokiarchaeota archaeon]
MTNRTIDLPDHIYKELIKLKRKDESISEVISRLIKKEKPIRSIKKFAGIFKILPKNGKPLKKLFIKIV